MNYETKIADYEQELDWSAAQAKRKRRIILGVAVAVLALALGYWMYSSNKADEKAALAAKGENKSAPTVTVIIPGRQMVDSNLSATGSLAARREMPVGVVGEGGMVTKVWVEPGSWVQAGQVLATIERSVQVQQTGQLAAQIAATQADARLAQNELQRAQALAGRGFISKAEIDRKTAQRDAAAARVRVAQAQLGENRARIGRLDIRAPASGLVLTRAVEPGQVIGAGSGVLFRIAKGGELELRALLSEADLARMRVGLQAKVTPVGTTQSFIGAIWQLSPVIDPNTRQGVARIALSYDPALRPGGFASALITNGVAEAPLLPESAVQSDPKGNYVFVVDAKNHVERRDVTVGSIGDKGVSILSGLQGNERVVRNAAGFLNPGESVIPNLLKEPK
jgi:HlyD family secretion protein